MTPPPAKKSDLGVRAASAAVMLVVAGSALWLGGWWWTALVVAVALAVLFEFSRLVWRITPAPASRFVWMLFGLVFVGVSTWFVNDLRQPWDGIYSVASLLLVVIGVDVGAYAAGRTFGGPKIAPSISPSKTWAGLIGGSLLAGIFYAAMEWAWPAALCDAYWTLTHDPAMSFRPMFAEWCHIPTPPVSVLWQLVLFCVPIAVIAQAGDFFESWMKRRAGVKDSGSLIPGHGGVFDRVDGLLAVAFVAAVVSWIFQ